MARDITRDLIEVLTRDLKVDPASIGPDTPLFEGGLELDSFAVVEVITRVESKFGIQFSDEDFDPATFSTVGKLARVVETYLPASA